MNALPLIAHRRHCLIQFLRHAVIGLLWTSLSPAGAADLPPQRPSSDEVVVARLRSSRLPAAERELRQMRRSLSGDPENLPLALTVARRCIVRSREEADPRFLGGAAAALAPWWSLAAPDPEILILRATIRQSLHEFDAALADLNAAVARDPRQAQAWLTLATIHCVRGDFPAARQSAVRLAGLADELTVTTLIAQIASLTGQARAAQAALETVLRKTAASAPDATDDPAIRLWARTLLAEISARLGDREAAERHFQSALTLGPRDPFLLGSYADFLLDQGRRDDVSRLLRSLDRVDALQLRLAEATGDPGAISRLGERLEAALARGDRVHLREAARFELRLRHNPAVALRLAQENWAIQQEPADARVLYEAARAAGDVDAEQAVLAWIKRTGLEDVALFPPINSGPPGHPTPP